VTEPDPEELVRSLPWPVRPGDGAELAQLCAADQADRPGGARLAPGVGDRDRVRRARVVELLDSGRTFSAADRFHAALVLQHGDQPQDHLLAHHLALSAADAGHPSARWLSAAALDRHLMRRGRPQRFGTQFVDRGAGWCLHEVDPMVTDEERAAWDVPPLAAALERAAAMNSAIPEHPPPAR
jgi:hypothetical protein